MEDEGSTRTMHEFVPNQNFIIVTSNGTEIFVNSYALKNLRRRVASPFTIKFCGAISFFDFIGTHQSIKVQSTGKGCHEYGKSPHGGKPCKRAALQSTLLSPVGPALHLTDTLMPRMAPFRRHIDYLSTVLNGHVVVDFPDSPSFLSSHEGVHYR